MTEILRSIGIMTGTSIDGVDIALMETDGIADVKCIDGFSVAFPKEIKEVLQNATFAASSNQNDEDELLLIKLASDTLTRFCADLLKPFIAKHGNIDIIGFHGQTVLHKPEIGFTWQLGNAQLMADMTGIKTVFRFRENDMNHGGQGAPLVPIYHKALYDAANLTDATCIINIGGVANLTFIGTDKTIMGFDTGPGNGLIDAYMNETLNLPYDKDGQLASQGMVNETALNKLLDNPALRMPPPRSFDRYDFNYKAVEGLSTEDACATLCAFTVKTIAISAEFLPKKPKNWYICGGGLFNQTLYTMLTEEFGTLKSVTDLGTDASLLEAEAFAYLAVRSYKNLPITYPETTGVDYPVSGGIVFMPACADVEKRLKRVASV
jgi:anhydro-N-acetylmuramic acid kinase